jgi:hypothetical protein
MKTFVYTPQIPTGDARTRGYGKTCRVLVIRAGENFRTLNSRHKVLHDFGTVRMDYGLERGYSRRILDAAEDYCRMVQLPEPRTTMEEF